MKAFDPEFVKLCKEKLIEAKQDFLNRYRTAQNTMVELAADKGGDEADQTLRILAEKESLLNQRRLRETLSEIEAALARIERGQYGICEECDEPIEAARLLALPWTRLSIEGAENRESKNSLKKID